MSKIHTIFISVFIAILPLLTLFFMYLYSHNQIHYVLPSKEYYSKGTWPYSNNQTKIKSFTADSQSISLEYMLNGNTPYAGFGITLAAQFPLLDLSKYSELHITISAENKTQIGICLKSFEPGITEVKEDAFIHTRQKEIHSEIDNKMITTVFLLKEFEDPEWWITENALGKNLDKNAFRFSHALQIFFYNNQFKNQMNKIEFKEVSFHIFSQFFWLIFFIGIVVYYLLYGSIILILRVNKKKKDNKEKLLSTYKKIEKISHRQMDTERIYGYIKDNYNDPNVSLDTIVTATGLSRKRIATLMQQEYNMSLKECINWLRHIEAKRLLLETDLNITEIAFTLGYNSSSYFGVLFKNQEGMSPNEYRKKQKSDKKV